MFGTRSFTFAQRRTFAANLVYATALTAVLTVSAPTLLPCPVAGVHKGMILGDDEAVTDGPSAPTVPHDDGDNSIVSPTTTAPITADHHAMAVKTAPLATVVVRPVSCHFAAASSSFCPAAFSSPSTSKNAMASRPVRVLSPPPRPL
ncbi:hypothetical protein BC828DRAFT_405632 [Blastocladiella britannica]|nr:hypothetical protein BC828DRAFT_405632 [Blastocladiella britannica]